ncbi:armadillo-type protein [Vararia minispora EC-137]|uniref:Armadillo-type protein n=1 Tax=Vararia minispora EC-137 TaxID=1314806 RepID=A0ACB8QWC6_9AGAM|nr:armadillo-type protein [Vararia minispora EC-137]
MEKEEGEITEDQPATVASAGKDVLRIDTSTPSPETRRRPGPLDLKNVNSVLTPSLPSALATARIIDDLGSVTYPEGIKSPKPELNVNAAKGKFRYDRDFLMQFMSVCKEKPDNLPALDAIGLEPSDQTFGIVRGGSGRSRVSSLQAPSGNRGTGIGLGFSPSTLGKASTSGFQMGNFSTPVASKLSSEERFALSNSARSASTNGMPAAVAGRPAAMARTSSQGGPNDRRRTRSSRGHTRETARQGTVSNHPSQAPTNMAPPLEPVVPLEQSENRWVAPTSKRGAGPDTDSPEMVDRKVKALLNKLTMERFDSISDQIIAWANKSEKEKNGQTLIQVIRLVFEKATDEATFSEMYARLCRKMMEQISTKVQDDGILNGEGKPFAGGQLFRKYLLNRCQEDFERGWNQKETTAAAAAVKATEDQAVKEAAEKDKESGKDTNEVELYSDEYYAAAKAKRRGLGLIRFIGELFKLQMLTERIMHECIKKLLGNVEDPEEEEIESLCKLLSTVGQLLDTQRARAHMDVYFSRMKELTKSKNVNSRMTFMLLDVIELRENKWTPRNLVAAPTTIAQIHEAAAKEKAQAERDAANLRQSTMSRGGSRRGGDRSEGPVVGPDGWAVAGASNAVRPPPKVGDLSQFGKISSKGQPMTFGPSSVFTKGGKETKGRDSSVSRTASSRNMFDMLSNADMAAEPPAGKSSRPPSRKPSADFTQTGVPEAAPQRKRLNLLPRTKPLEETKPDAGPEDEEEEEEDAVGPSLSEDEAKRKIDEDIKELFSIRSLDEAESYFTSLPADYHWLFIDKLVNKGIDGKAADIPLVGDLLKRAHEKDLASADALEQGFNGLAEIIDDIAIDVPKAFNNLADWLKAAGLGEDEERRARIANKAPEGGEKLLSLLAV